MALATVLFLAGCDATRRVPNGERLLVRNRVVVEDRSVPTDDLSSIIKQKANKRILGFPFYLHLWNLRDPAAVELKRAEKDSLCTLRNTERAARGRSERPCAHATKGRNGEPPVLLDEVLTERSTEQMRLYMQKEGWFQAVVTDTVHLRHRRLLRSGHGRAFKRPKAEVEYRVVPGPVYRYRNIRFTVDDPAIAEHMQRNWENTLLHAGDRFDADVLDAERTRITDRLKDIGYLYFNRDLVQYDADTTVGDRQVDITLRLERPYSRKERGLKGTPEGTVYQIGDVTLSLLQAGRSVRGTLPDTLVVKGHRFLFQGEQPAYKPHALLGAIFLDPGERFRQSNADRTYRRLTALRVFDRVDITYDTSGTQRSGLAHARIDLLPAKVQSLSLEGFATNRGGFLGTSVSVGYRHRNLFRGMGTMDLQMQLGFEAQQAFTGGGSTVEESTTGRAGSGLFNTIDLGPELTLRFPTFLLPLRRDRFSRSTAPSTLISAMYNLQQRPDYIRSVAKVSFGYEWMESRTKTWSIFPLEVNVIRIPEKSADFEQYLQSANDPVLTDSYTDHLIAGMRGQYVHNTQVLAKQRNTFFNRITVEWAGHPMFVPLSLLSRSAVDSAGNTFYTVGKIRYAEYVKLDSDFRWRHIIHEKSSMAFRMAAGVGVPYGNLGVLPFENSFFAGGANGLRAWRARSLGPGSFSAPLLAFDRIGECRLEGNVEYRFRLVGFLEGALFADVGNIWLLQEDPNRPGSGIDREFLSELAVGTGVGARLNFDFFIVRFDLALQTKDPSLPQGERWLFQPKEQHEAAISDLNGVPFTYRPQVNLNIGIGYPF